MACRLAVLVALACMSCESLRPPAPPPPSTPPRHEPNTPPTHPPAPQAGEREPITPVSATRSPQPQTDPLTLAAECLARDDHASAAIHLEAHVEEHPDQFMFRLQLAELLVRLDRDAHARVHYERFADDARSAPAAVSKQLVHVHTRLMEIALRQTDHFAEQLHRGVGLLLLVAEEDGKPDRAEELCEEMLCKALKALATAKELKPDDARVRLYLAEAYERTGNRRAAEVERAAARGAFVPGGMGAMLPR